ncbi:Zinc finger, FYVE/PHD-type [Cynara cardunculus var. scolymus]|uniref:Zinc finger, FYVE/PHD-type n=1 Tax=Cynara cardunculus var. scolymus TaxID=59895 RepID=A0A103XZW5_CYNCS|nr:Zinc finger, FYVE/PHD-type [Cynara cardunculus var. scolymus]
MKRELAFALEARSQFACFYGRTRSSKSPSLQFSNTRRKNKVRSSIDLSENLIDEVHVSRRRKRAKTGIPDGDSINVDKSKGDDQSATVKVAKGEEESATVEGEEESPTAEVAKGVEKDTKLAQVYVKRKNRKKQVNDSTLKRFTRSAVKEKEENVEELGTPTRKKMELKMSKKIGLGRMPTNMRELLETGMLEGFRVFYDFDNEGRNLQGLIRGAGILCSCNLCEGTKVISPSQFEMHARKSYRHAIKHICLENGKSLLEVIEVCKASALETLEVAFQAVISSFPEKGPSMCTRCKGSIEPSSTGNLLICDSCVVQAGEKIAICGEVRTSSPVRKAFASTLIPISSNKKSRRGRKRKSSKADLKSSKSAASCKLLRNKIKVKILKRSSRSASLPRSIESATKCTSSQQKNRTKLTMKLVSNCNGIPSHSLHENNLFLGLLMLSRNQGMHWSVFEDGGLPDGTELTYKLLDGYKLGRGIYCFCCNTEFLCTSVAFTDFHVPNLGSYENIYISNGVSLHEYAVSLKKNRRCPVKFNDDLCRICGDGGNLLLCDGCPRSFHQECASELSIPRGKWYCKYCQHSLKFVGESVNAVAAGRVTGIDPIEQITKRCIRIVKNPENNDLVACVLCRCHDFSKHVFNDRTVIVCDQCEKEYHIGCLKEHNMADLKALPKGKWFCCMGCERIHSILKNLLTREPEMLPDALLALAREKQKDNGIDGIAKSEMRFMLLSGKNASRETRSLLAQTVDIFHECFDPIIDATTGRDFIPSMGYFQLLFTCIERLLSSLKIKKIVLPAAEEAKSIWTKKFGFQTIAPEQLGDMRQTCSAMMTFKGTSMLQKEVPEAENGVTDAGDGIFNLFVE